MADFQSSQIPRVFGSPAQTFRFTWQVDLRGRLPIKSNPSRVRQPCANFSFYLAWPTSNQVKSLACSAALRKLFVLPGRSTCVAGFQFQSSQIPRVFGSPAQTIRFTWQVDLRGRLPIKSPQLRHAKSISNLPAHAPGPRPDRSGLMRQSSCPWCCLSADGGCPTVLRDRLGKHEKGWRVSVFRDGCF